MALHYFPKTAGPSSQVAALHAAMLTRNRYTPGWMPPASATIGTR